MNKKTTGILAGTAGAALLIGGGTFALWNDAANVGGGTITTGNLDIQEIEGGWSWVDLSEDRSDAGHEIADLDEHQIVPGDTIEGTIEFSAALQGDNLVAELGGEFGAVTVDPASTDAALLDDLIDASVVLKFSADGVDWTPVTDGLFTSEQNPEAGSLPQLPAEVGAANIRAVVTVTFSADATERELAQIAATFGDSTLELVQVRAGGGGF